MPVPKFARNDMLVSSPTRWPVLCREAWIDSLGRLRDSRALILRDAESFHEAAIAVEHVGQALTGEIQNGLRKYESALCRLVIEARAAREDEFKRLFQVIREARNMAVHEGAWARHLNGRLAELLSILEESIMNTLEIEKGTLLVSDLMVRTPVSAESWQPVYFARRAMLANSFSNLPLLHNGEWRFLSDVAVMRYLGSAVDNKHRRTLLGCSIGEAHASGTIALQGATCVDASTRVAEARQRINHLPLLITEKFGDQDRLVGIITAFDLL